MDHNGSIVEEIAVRSGLAYSTPACFRNYSQGSVEECPRGVVVVTTYTRLLLAWIEFSQEYALARGVDKPGR
jgi:hypothetical protein